MSRLIRTINPGRISGGGGARAVPIIESVGTVGISGGAATHVYAPPCAGYDAGDLLVLMVGQGGFQNEADRIITPGGWTSAVESYAAYRHLRIFWKVATEAAVNQYIGMRNNSYGFAQQIRISGANLTTPIDGSFSNSSMPANTVQPVLGYTTVNDNVLALMALLTQYNSIPFTLAGDGWAFTGQSAYQNGAGGCFASRDVPIIGPTTTATVTLTGGGSASNGLQIGIQSA